MPMFVRSLLRYVWRPAGGLLWAAVVALITLQPGRRTWQGIDQLPEFCLICGTRGAVELFA